MNVSCPNCGSVNDSANKFCFKCGTSLAGAAPVDVAASSSPTPPTSATSSDGPETAMIATAAVPEPPAPAPGPPGVAPDLPAADLPAADLPAAVPGSSNAAPVPPAAVPVPPAAVPMTPAAGSPPLAPAGPPPPPPPPVTPSSPMTSSGPPTGRLPMPLLIGGLVAILVLGAGIGIALGLTKGDSKPGPSGNLLTPKPGPGGTPKPIASAKPNPTNGSVSPTAVPQTLVPATPTPAPVTPTVGPVTPTPGPGGQQTVAVTFVSVSVPSDWTVSELKDTYFSVYPSIGGQLYLESGYLTKATTTAEYLQGEIDWRKAKFPDVKICKDEADVQLPNGPLGRSVHLCYTAQTQSGKTYPAHAFIAVSVGTDGKTLYYLKIYADAGDYDKVVDAVIPTLSSVQWKLFAGGG